MTERNDAKNDRPNNSLVGSLGKPASFDPIVVSIIKLCNKLSISMDPPASSMNKFLSLKAKEQVRT